MAAVSACRIAGSSHHFGPAMKSVIWVGLCLRALHSAMSSGLNRAYFNPSHLRLDAEASADNKVAAKTLFIKSAIAGADPRGRLLRGN